MDCKELFQTELKAELVTAKSILVIGFRDRVSNMIDELRSDGEQHFVSMGFLERTLAGHYDAAVIDGSSTFINPYAVFETQYPYLARNVKSFYILK